MCASPRWHPLKTSLILRQVRVWLGTDQDHYYVLSRFLVSRMLTVTKLPPLKAVKIALELKKALVDSERLNLTQVSDGRQQAIRLPQPRELASLCQLVAPARCANRRLSAKICTEVVAWHALDRRRPVAAHYLLGYAEADYGLLGARMFSEAYPNDTGCQIARSRSWRSCCSTSCAPRGLATSTCAATACSPPSTCSAALSSSSSAAPPAQVRAASCQPWPIDVSHPRSILTLALISLQVET